MARHGYNIKTLMRMAQRSDLKLFFQKENLLPNFDFSTVTSRNIEPLYQAWLELSDEIRTRQDIIFREIFELSGEDGTIAFLEESRWDEHKERYPEDQDNGLSQRLSEMGSHYERTFWVYFNRPEYWRGINFYNHAYSSNAANFWRKRRVKLSAKLNLSDTAIKALSKALGLYYHQREGTGKNCLIDTFNWYGQDHFFCYLQSHSEVMPEWVNGEFERRPHNPAFEIIFRYHKEDNTLELHAKGGKDVASELQSLFAKHILDIEDLPIETKKDARIYDLARFANPTFNLKLDTQNSGIEEVRIKSLKILLFDGSNHRITFENDPEKDDAYLYERLYTAVKNQFGGGSIRFMVVEVSLSIQFEAQNTKKPSIKTVKISHPQSITDGTSQAREEIRKMLKRSGVDLVEPEQDDGDRHAA